MPQKKTEQVQMQKADTLKTNSGEMLSTQEAELLNSLLEKSRDTFDFYGKKVAFITGPTGNRFLSKPDYFSKIRDWADTGNTPSTFMVLLTQEEKDKSGGYDVLVSFFVKGITNRQKRRIIEKLAKGE